MYECFIRPGFAALDIEADSAADARRQFVQRIRDSLEAGHVIANNLDTDDGNDPVNGRGNAPNTARTE